MSTKIAGPKDLEPRMKRPLSVTIVALYWFMGVVLFLVVLVVGILQPAFVQSLRNPNLVEDIQNAQTHQGVHALLILIFTAIGLGLWFLQSVARRTVVLITGLHLALQAVRIVLSTLVHASGPHRALGTFFWFTTVISAAMFVYLRQSHVKDAFTRPKM